MTTRLLKNSLRQDKHQPEYQAADGTPPKRAYLISW